MACHTSLACLFGKKAATQFVTFELEDVAGYDQQDWHKINKEQGLQSVVSLRGICLRSAWNQVRRAMVQHTEMRVRGLGLLWNDGKSLFYC